MGIGKIVICVLAGTLATAGGYCVGKEIGITKGKQEIAEKYYFNPEDGAKYKLNVDYSTLERITKDKGPMPDPDKQLRDLFKSL